MSTHGIDRVPPRHHVDELRLIEGYQAGRSHSWLWHTLNDLPLGGDTRAPATPTGLVATPGLGEVALNWNNNIEPDLDSYEVWIGTAEVGPYVFASSITVNHTVAGLLADGDYWFRLVAVDEDGNHSLPSAPVPATVLTPTVDVTAPAAPVLSATEGLVDVPLTWTIPAGDPVAYQVKKGPSGGPHVVIASLSAPPYTDTAVSPGTEYFYVVTAVDASGNESLPSNEVSPTTAAAPPAPGSFPPPALPQVVVREDYPASPHVTLGAGESIQGAMDAGHRIIRLTNGASYGNQQINPYTGAYIYAPAGAKSIHRGGQVYNRRFCTGDRGASNVTLRNMDIAEFFAEISGSAGRGVIRTSSGSEYTGWKFIDLDVWFANNGCYEFRGNTHQVIGGTTHDYGRYAITGGSSIDVLGHYSYRGALADGTELVPQAADTNRGFCKHAAGASGIFRYEDNTLEKIHGQGIWHDGSSAQVRAKRNKGIDVVRATVFIEVSFPGPHLIEDTDTIRGAGGLTGSNIDWPMNASVAVSLSPNVTIRRTRARGVGGGIGLTRADHPTLTNGIPGDNVTPEEARANLGLNNIDIEDYDLQANRYIIGQGGGANGLWPDLLPLEVTITGQQLAMVGDNPQYGADPRFRWGPHIQSGDSSAMTKAQWDARTFAGLTK